MPTTVLTSIEEAMKTLDAQWYNAVVQGLGLDRNTFQLQQGSLPLGTTSEQLWNVLDAVPPRTVTYYFNPNQSNVFSDDYGAVLFRLKAQGQADFERALGDYFTKWLDAWRDYDGDLDILQYFQTWCEKNVGTSICTNAYSALLAMKNDPIVKAQEMFVAAGGFASKKAYNRTIQDLRNDLPSGQTKTADMDSETTSRDVQNTWAKASASGWYRFFSAGGGTSYKKLEEKITASSILVSAKFDKVVTFAAGPLAKASTDPILRDFNPWYLGSVLAAAYNTPDNTLWMNGTPNWDSTFGSDGNMLRRASAVVVVDGIEVEVTATASLSKTEQEEFKVAARGGFWPFFEASGEGGWSHDYAFNDRGEVTVSSSAPRGNPNILGVIVTPAPDYFTS